jgi:DNA polymerase-3 subunit gamma/tau
MSYQALARKWRPKRFDEVVGQRGVTQTLRNMLGTGRIAQAFVFAGPRGVGKTTTARILARALTCAAGPTTDPCGACDACVEIAEGRDIDVLEIDAATHTQVDTVREVIISSLAMAPVRDRFKIFIIDEVHQLSTASFNALLKSIEEPPAHVVFMMATTEIGKIPDTILSRSQVFELKTIGTRAIAEQLRKIADAEGIEVEEAALSALARWAEGSLRDAESAFDQVIAFAGDRVTAADVEATLGLVGRDLLLQIAEAVASEHAPALFELAGRAMEAGHDPRQVCRELAKLARDLLVVQIDRARLDDPEIALEGERDRLQTIAGLFSREDLMRGFDVLAKAEADIRTAAQPRYHLEMALVRWVHLRKLVPLSDLMDQMKGQPAGAAPGPRPAPPARPTPAAVQAPPRAAAPPAPAAPGPHARPPRASEEAGPAAPPPAQPDLKEALLAEIRRSKRFLYNTVVAQAQRIEIAGDRITFVFGAAHRGLRTQLDRQRAWLEAVASELARRKIAVVSAQEGGEPAPAPAVSADEERKARLKAEAMSDEGVQALLDVFGAEIRDVEEIGEKK